MSLSDISGAYRHDDNPETIFVFAMAWALGGLFSAIRRDGVWRPASLTCGDIDADWRATEDIRAAAALLKEARMSRSLALQE